jgi:hypothetical protein
MASVPRRKYHLHMTIEILLKTRGLTDEHLEVASSSVANDKQCPKPARALFGCKSETLTAGDVVRSSGSYMG